MSVESCQVQQVSTLLYCLGEEADTESIEFSTTVSYSFRSSAVTFVDVKTPSASSPRQ